MTQYTALNKNIKESQVRPTYRNSFAVYMIYGKEGGLTQYTASNENKKLLKIDT